jgi:outer membrane lipopolysaccharide assembly protein LptE/RlpB
MKTWAVVAMLAGLSGCGYHISGKGDFLPKNLQTIAIPAFTNITGRYKLPEKLASALTREFISRTRYSINADPNGADAVLRGSVLRYDSYVTTFDPATNRGSSVQVVVTLKLTLVERASGKVLFDRPAMEVRERYEIGSDQRAYLEESDAAVDRLSRDVARSVVSAVLEGF